MKMRPHHYQAIETRVVSLLNSDPAIHARYIAREFPRADKVKDINKRFRWDVLRVVMPAHELWDTLYSYLDDTHIDSALRNIFRKWPIH